MYNARLQGIASDAPVCLIELDRAQAGVSLRLPVLEFATLEPEL